MDTTTAEIIDLAQDLLSHRYGGSQQLNDPQTLSGSGAAVVLRVKVASQPFLQQRSVIVKYIPETGDSIDDAALLREVAAYQFTTSLSEEVRPGPVLIAHDIDRRVIVISDSGDGDTFEALLRQTDPTARQQILRNLGTALGRMHAGTAGKEEQFNVLLNRILKSYPDLESSRDIRDRSLGPAISIGVALVENSGLSVPDAVREGAQDAAARLNTGRSRAFTPFDLSPDNIIVSDRTHFLDYEWAGFRDVSFDLACVVGGFPQYVGTRMISDDEAEVFVRAWVDEVTPIWPNAAHEDQLHNLIATALMGWAFSSVAMLHHGSLTNALTTLGDLDDTAPSTSTRLLRRADEGPFTDEERYIRRDFYETFDALSRFVAGSRAPNADVIADFSRQVADRLSGSH